LQAKAAGGDRLLADSATRRLERAYVAGAHYMADELQQRGEIERARLALELARALYPDRVYPNCRLKLLGEPADPDALASCLAQERPQ
ncbi:MAG: hypothetical protein ABI588_09485, partial [Arenimonas sp.]